VQGLYVGHIRRRKGRVRRQIEYVGTCAQRTPNTSADLRISGFIKIDIDITVNILFKD